MRGIGLLSLFLLIVSIPGICTQIAVRDLKEEEAIWGQLQLVAPASVQTFKEATVLMESGNHKEAADLYRQVVAREIKTRPIDEIRITPFTELAVYERGSRREKSQDKAQRILILGSGVLNGFRENAFRAVLAHEYGHFAHRDTAGGEVAMRVNNDMMKFAQAMVLSGQAVWYNLAFHFLCLYHFLFRRIGYGASRLQEILADRMAALKYGADSFEEGLSHVIRRTAEFNYMANREINHAVKSSRSLQNLYDLQMEKESTVEKDITVAMNRQTSEDDTHPSPVERFRLIRQLHIPGAATTSGMVWDLFVNREAVTSQMSEWVNKESIHSMA